MWLDWAIISITLLASDGFASLMSAIGYPLEFMRCLLEVVGLDVFQVVLDHHLHEFFECDVGFSLASREPSGLAKRRSTSAGLMNLILNFTTHQRA